MKPFNFIKQDTLSKILAQKNSSSSFIAGGTNLVDLMKKDIARPDALLDITAALPGKIEETKTGLRIGAMSRNSAVANNEAVIKKYPLLAKAILAGASPQIRNMASSGGNLLQRTRCPYFYDITTPCNKRKPGEGCSAYNGENRMSAIIGYSNDCVAVHPSDFCVALAALDATVVIKDKGLQQKNIPFRYFHRLPGNTPDKDNDLPANTIIEYIDVPVNSFHKNFSYLKLRDRDSYAFALVSVAAALQLNGNTITAARLASGGVAHKPWRWYDAEKFLEGREATDASFTAAAEIACKDVKPLSHNGFKKDMLRGAIITALQHCLNA
ncbi:MAG: xanthine dehydrogenase family protein subunit M [Ferruginibacter sp.]